MNQSQAYQLLRDFLQNPNDPTLRRDTLRYLAHAALRELRHQKRILDEGFGDREQCPRCWGTLFDEIGTETPCDRCKENGVPVGTIPKP